MTYGKLNRRKDNAVLVTSFHGGNHHGYDFLIGSGRALDTAKYYVVVSTLERKVSELEELVSNMRGLLSL